jgi:hypothetical protein
VSGGGLLYLVIVQSVTALANLLEKRVFA